MRQRAMIAMALSCNPRLVIADEPTTALDVTTQAQLLELMKAMVEEFNTSLVIVTHNLGVVARYAQTIYIMYAGRIVESGKCKEIFARPPPPLHHRPAALRAPHRRGGGPQAGGHPRAAAPPGPPARASAPSCPAARTPSSAAARTPGRSSTRWASGHYTRCYVNPEGASV